VEEESAADELGRCVAAECECSWWCEPECAVFGYACQSKSTEPESAGFGAGESCIDRGYASRVAESRCGVINGIMD
jgi:hypothetical protein